MLKPYIVYPFGDVMNKKIPEQKVKRKFHQMPEVAALEGLTGNAIFAVSVKIAKMSNLVAVFREHP